MPKNTKPRKHNRPQRFSPYTTNATKTSTTLTAKPAPADFMAFRKVKAVAWLAMLEDKIGKGIIAARTKATGGVKLVWSKYLQRTAGHTRSWRVPLEDGTTAWTSIITLSTRLITDEERLRFTLTHEYCHVAEKVIDGSRGGHGEPFKKWGRIAEEALKDYGIKVTTFHTYPLDFKYMWACGGQSGVPQSAVAAEKADNQGAGCGAVIGRFRRTDFSKKVCAHCRGKLVLIKSPDSQEADVFSAMKEKLGFGPKESAVAVSKDAGNDLAGSLLICAATWTLYKWFC